MAFVHKYVPLSERERPVLADGKVVGEVDPSEVFEITVKLHPRSATTEQKAALLKQMENQAPAEREYLSRQEFGKKFGADPADLEKVVQYARENHLTVVATNPAARTITLRGSAETLTHAFPTDLKQYDSPAGGFRSRTGAIHIPEELQGIIEAIFGFDNRPQAEARKEKK